MTRIQRVRVPAPAPRGLATGQVQKILAAIPRTQQHDWLLFGLIASTGLRAGEALSPHVEDLDLSTDDEHISVLGKGDRRRTVLRDDSQLVSSLRRYALRRNARQPHWLSSSGYPAGHLSVGLVEHMGSPYACVMTHDQAIAEATRRSAAQPDATWVAAPRKGHWIVVRISMPPPPRPTRTATAPPPPAPRDEYPYSVPGGHAGWI